MRRAHDSCSHAASCGRGVEPRSSDGKRRSQLPAGACGREWRAQREQALHAVTPTLHGGRTSSAVHVRLDPWRAGRTFTAAVMLRHVCVVWSDTETWLPGKHVVSRGMRTGLAMTDGAHVHRPWRAGRTTAAGHVHPCAARGRLLLVTRCAVRPCTVYVCARAPPVARWAHVDCCSSRVPTPRQLCAMRATPALPAEAARSPPAKLSTPHIPVPPPPFTPQGSRAKVWFHKTRVEAPCRHAKRYTGGLHRGIGVQQRGRRAASRARGRASHRPNRAIWNGPHVATTTNRRMMRTEAGSEGNLARNPRTRGRRPNRR
jgi:hypothetical protein